MTYLREMRVPTDARISLVDAVGDWHPQKRTLKEQVCLVRRELQWLKLQRVRAGLDVVAHGLPVRSSDSILRERHLVETSIRVPFLDRLEKFFIEKNIAFPGKGVLLFRVRE